MQTRISRLFERLRAEKRPALIAYIVAGDPSPAATPELVAALERGGADLIELGVPFSDPIADGPVIQRGSDRALKAGTKLTTVLDIASQIRKQSEIPLLLFTYMNPVLRYGLEPLARAAVASGIDGCLLTDLSVEEAEPYIHVMRQAGLDTVFLAAPTSSQRRLELVAKYSTGFVYLVSRTGVTGERSDVSDSVGTAGGCHASHHQSPAGRRIRHFDRGSCAVHWRSRRWRGGGQRVRTRHRRKRRTSPQLYSQRGRPGQKTRQWFTIEEPMSPRQQ